MTVTRLTSVGIKRLRPPTHGRADYADTVLPGLHLRVTEKGRKSWSVVYRVNGKQRRMTLGSYPIFDLAQARDAAREALQAVGRGEDPVELRRARATRRGDTFEVVAREFIERYAKKRKHHKTPPMLGLGFAFLSASEVGKVKGVCLSPLFSPTSHNPFIYNALWLRQWHSGRTRLIWRSISQLLGLTFRCRRRVTAHFFWLLVSPPPVTRS